jgi:D-glycero-alpha-D-manno-heptose-7-phosphate kinase
MIITKTPFRISFVGGGSDLESFYSQYIGAVLSTTIDKYMYISSHNFFDTDKIRLKYSKTETADSIAKIDHPIVRTVLEKFSVHGALEISSNADVPAGTGMGSSSSFTVGLLHNLYTRFSQFVTKERLAHEACDIEINKLKEPIGKQDQYAAAYGGLNVIKFNPEGTVHVEMIHLPPETYQRLQENLLMFYTGIERETSSILSEQKENMSIKNKVDILREMVSLVWEMRDALYKNDLDIFGRILHHNWLLKQQLAIKISSSHINDLYAKGVKNGALGGKLLGAGGGGFLLFYCEKDRQAKLREAMKGMQELEFKFESEGSKVIYIGDE